MTCCEVTMTVTRIINRAAMNIRSVWIFARYSVIRMYF